MPLSCLVATQKLEDIKVLQQNFEVAVSRALGEIRDFEEADDLYKKLDSALVELKKDLTESLEKFEYNKEQAREFRLKEVCLEAYPNAQKWIDTASNGEKNVHDESNTLSFLATWEKENPGLHIPNTALEYTGEFSYFSDMAAGHLYKANDAIKVLYVPEWDNVDMILVEDWVECDYGKVNATGKSVFETEDYKSPLIDFDGLELGTRVGKNRKEIDEALWNSGFAYGEKTDKHKQVLQKLGLDPEEFTIRLIRFEEYVRLAASQKFGEKEINIHFDGYYATPKSKNFCGLKGEHIDFGSTAGTLSYISLKDSGTTLAFRLVIAREKK